MAYSVQADLQNAIGGLDRLTQLCDWDGDGVIDAGVITAAVVKADSLIDSYASKNYTVPFNPVPVVITTTSADLALVILRRQRQMATHDDELRWEQIAGPEGWLSHLARGIVTPGGDPLPLKHSTMAPDTVDSTVGGDRELSRGKLSGFW